jgi:hypothetical protein
LFGFKSQQLITQRRCSVRLDLDVHQWHVE